MITLQEAQWQLAEKMFDMTRLEGEEAILAFGEANGVPRTDQRASRFHLKRIWVTNGERVGCEECGSMPDFIGNEEHSARLLDAMLAEGWQVNFDRMAFDMPDGHVSVFMRRAKYTGGLSNAADRKRALFLLALGWKQIEIPEELQVRP